MSANQLLVGVRDRHLTFRADFCASLGYLNFCVIFGQTCLTMSVSVRYNPSHFIRPIVRPDGGQWRAEEQS